MTRMIKKRVVKILMTFTDRKYISEVYRKSRPLSIGRFAKISGGYLVYFAQCPSLDKSPPITYKSGNAKSVSLDGYDVQDGDGAGSNGTPDRSSSSAQMRP